MKILLVRPWANQNITTVKNFMFGEPLGIECVSTILKELEHEVLLVDFMVEENAKLSTYLKAFNPDIVGITSQCTDVENVLKMATLTKQYKSNIIVLVGGVQATCFPNAFFYKNVDYVFRSTTRANFKQLMQEIESKNTPRLIEGIYSKALGFINEGYFCFNEYIVPDRSSTKKYRHKYQYTGFKPCAILQTAYGCRNKCTFCVRWKLEGSQLREIDIAEIVDQIESLDEPYIMICDNDFLINEKRLAEFCDLLEQRNIRKKYMCYGSVNSILEKPHILNRLNNNGLMAVIVGYESFDDSRLSAWSKAATVDENVIATEFLHKNNIAAWGSFIIHPDWDKTDFKKLIQYIDRIKPELISFSPLVPHPLTPLYDEYKERLIYSKEDYDKWNFGDVLIKPSKMSLKSYYWQVLMLAVRINLNSHSLKYIRKNIPLKNSIRMTLGFKSLLKVYVKNILRKDH